MTNDLVPQPLFEEKEADIDNDKDKKDGNDFVKIFDGTLNGWEMAGKGGVLQ